MKFDLPKEQLSHIKVIGVGGGGSNAVNHMFRQGIKDVDFMVCNTDQQALDISPVPVKIQLGSSLTSGLGAGSKAEVGENAAIESIEEIKEILGEETKMIFITAGMGGGTGTGAAPVIARAALELGILTVGIVTMPFSFEGKKRRRRADEGINNMRESVDTLLVINNDKLREMFGNLSLDNAFEQADNVLTTAAKGIAEAITNTGKINVDFNDVKTVMHRSGVAIMGSARAQGENRATLAVESAVNSPLLNENDIKGAAHVLLNITYGKDSILMDEITEITDFIEEAAGEEAEVIWGHGTDERLENDEISITIIATGFSNNPDTGATTTTTSQPQTRVISLDEEVRTELTRPIQGIKPTPPPVQQANMFEVKEQPEEIQQLEDTAVETSTEVEESTSLAISKTVDASFEEESAASQESEEIETYSDPVSSEDSSIVIRHTLDDEELEKEEEQMSTFASEAGSANEGEVDDMEPVLKKPEVKTEVRQEEKKAPETPVMSNEERQKVIQERMARLRNLSNQLKTPSGISSIENEPAFKRRDVKLEEIDHSSESQVSRLSLTETEDEDGNKKTELRSNNTFLHDNVD